MYMIRYVLNTALDQEIMPIVPPHDIAPMDLLPLDFPSAQGGLCARGEIEILQLRDRTSQGGVAVFTWRGLDIGWVIAESPYFLEKSVHSTEASEVGVVF